MLSLLAALAFSLAYQWPLAINLSSPGIVLNGVYDPEGRTTATPYRWTNGDAHLWFLGIGRQAYHVTLTLSSARPADANLPTVTLLANATQITSFPAPRPLRDSAFEIPAEAISASGDLDLVIRSDTFAPPNDLRSLGVALYALRIESASSPFAPTWPAAAPLLWGVLATGLVFLAAVGHLPKRAAWAIALLLVVLISAGFALMRIQTVELLPWAVLAAVLLFVLTRRKIKL